MRILDVQREVETLRKENHTGGIAVNTIDTNGTIASRVTKETDILVCVSQVTTSKSWN